MSLNNHHVELAPSPPHICVRCEVTQDIDQFQKNKTYKHGRDRTCRECRREDRRGRYRRNSAKTAPEQKTCTVCRATKPGTEFPKSHSADGRQPFCRECKGLQAKSRMYGISREEFLARLANQGGGCGLCGVVLEAITQYHVDHDHSCCKYGSSCGSCIRALVCGNCNPLVIPGYERLPEELKTWELLNRYLEGALW